ncbi:multicopper oxidase family protein [Oharaeibacter diazotrophicus]|uniref:Spore coat protein A n=1 Tax=Oharaeibacter diazotrophicus TaxID=1920512 RepID=A0A4R6RBT3_9HYPH|nr:multicopper oxidase domain-containing protein [Oharaeibacter diazotrophicus]TDP83529.1 spore coat protein A [Oharaeibacter diazotrophicus]BBE72362.1 spore coat protein A [Pleomorphomonas sp. SM30]GLS79133.1 spore coat protein [Oharaeibacter diazotrophicus]
MTITRRRFLAGTSLAAGAAMAGALPGGRPAVAAAGLTPFVDRLPVPPPAKPVGKALVGPYPTADVYRMTVGTLAHRFHRDLPLSTVWGYNGSYPGPTISAVSGRPLYVQWVNGLPNAPHPLWSPAFAAAHGPGIGGTSPDAARTVAHLHGGRVPPDADGWPEEIVLPGRSTKPYLYPNFQEAATLWYHDHALGITRLNVMMGLAGAYVIKDGWENALPLPKGAYDVPLIVQDRMLTSLGRISYPLDLAPEFFGDVNVVNGKVWPYLDVARGKYRFRVVNGCNSKFLDLAFADGRAFAQIASDQGLLPAPEIRTSVRLAPGERVEIVADFQRDRPGAGIVLVNRLAPAPYPGGGNAAVPENVMAFRVGSAYGHTAALPTKLRTVLPSVPQQTRWTTSQYLEKIPESAAKATRRFTLIEATNTGTAICVNAGGFTPAIRDEAGKIQWSDPLPFKVKAGDVEIWEFTNETVDTHPVHVHLAQMQLLGRISPPGTPAAGSAEGPGVVKDTWQLHPGETIRLIGRFEGYPGKYAFHCHILEHEDCEMMRWFELV